MGIRGKTAFLPLEFAIKVVVLALAAARHVWLKENLSLRRGANM